MLYSPENHEPLTDAPWDEERARAGIPAIAAVAEAALSERPANLYDGASGVVWALHQLAPHHDSRLDLEDAADRALEGWRASPDVPERLEPPVRTHASLFFGETGPLVVSCLLGSGPADDLYARVSENAASESNELMSGSPGTMLVAKAMLDRTGEERWGDTWREAAEILWERRDAEGLWMHEPYGRGLGGAHGACTNARVLLQGGELLSGDRRETLGRELRAAYARYAVVEDGLANWPMVAEEGLVGWDGRIRAQWCHGAAGVVASSASFLEEELLLAGAELCWQAGPPSLAEKGPGLCHGTAGTGYAFLKVFERTGDELWLERARRFAVHALEQVERGSGRPGLWPGDLGAALLAADCLDVRAQMPVVDRL